ncbi:MAG: DHH family phosphoesterase, partial [Nanoarchaeota archaeon]
LSKSKKIYDFSSQLGSIASLFSAGKDKVGGERLALEIALEAGSPKELLDCSGKAAILCKHKKIREDEIKYYTSDWRNKAEKYGNLIIYEIAPKNEIISAVSTEISMQIKDKTVVVLRTNNNSMKVSYRNQNAKVDCNKLALQLAQEFNGIGGGHRQAAGGLISENKREEFKKRLRELVK